MKPLTPYLRKAYDESAKSWRQTVLNTSPIDRPRAVAAVTRARRLAGIPGVPFFFWMKDPIEAMAFIAETDASTLTRKVYVSDQLTKYQQSYYNSSNVFGSVVKQTFARVPPVFKWREGDPVSHHSTHMLKKKDGPRTPDEIFRVELNQLSGWAIHQYVFAVERLGLNVSDDTRKKVEVAAEVVQSCGLWWNHQDVVVMSERPSKIELDEEDRLHSLSGPALCYGEDFRRFLIHGVAVEADVVTSPAEVITPRRIECEANVEVRRTLLDLYGGSERYLRQTGATVIHEGRNGRKLWWRAPYDSRNANAWQADTIFSASSTEPLVMVEVVNSTPEADGSLKHYFLRVPPHIRDANAAVAWTFGLTLDEYEPNQET